MHNVFPYSGKHALVLGLGESGLAMARWLAECGAAVRVADTRAADAPGLAERVAALRAAAPGVQIITGQDLGATLLDGIDFVAPSPGLMPHRELAAIIPAAQEKDIPLWGEIELFAQALAALRAAYGYAPKVLAITGTNGKTTVTRLTGLLCERAGLTVKVAGNISPAALDVLRDELNGAQQELEQVAADKAQQARELAEREAAALALPTVLPTAADVTPAVAQAAAQEFDEAESAVAVDADAGAELEEEEEAPAIDDSESATEAQAEANAVDEDALPVPVAPPAPPKPKAQPTSLPQAWVLELSSFQLHTTRTLQADAAALLNVTQDHLDWHGSMESYIADKGRIFGARTVRVLNRDDDASMQFATPVSVSFGLDAPTRADGFGLVDENGMQWLAYALADEAEQAPKRRSKKAQLEVIDVPYTVQRLMPAEALKIRGLHNASNALAALALCRAIDLPLAPLLHGLRDYRGEPHRVELTAVLQEVEYYDDSKGTNVGATVAALNGLGHGGRPNRLLLIAGGDGKGQDFAPLAQPVSRYARAVLLIGRDAALIRAALTDTGVELIDCVTLEAAVERAAQLAQPGDAVLLSPACASLDMFRNYAHRAEVFVDAVREIGLAAGEVLA